MSDIYNDVPEKQLSVYTWSIASQYIDNRGAPIPFLNQPSTPPANQYPTHC